LPIPKEIKSFIWMVSIGSCLAIIAETSVGDWSSIYLKEDLHLPIGVNTIGYSCFVLAQIISRFSVGRWIDLYGIPVVIRVGGLLGRFGVAPMPPSYVSVAGGIPGLPTTRALTRLAIISSTGFFIGRFLISSFAGLFGLPIALLFPATALIGSGVMAHFLDLKRIKTSD